jgi:hypothetical protein
VLGWPYDLGQIERRVDQRHVREGLGKVAEKPARGRIVLLGEETNVVAQAEKPLEEVTGLVLTSE